MKNKKSNKGIFKLIYIVIIALSISGILYTIKENDNRNFEENKEFTYGVVSEIELEIQSSEMLSYKRYVIEYKYKVNNEILTKLFECKFNDVNEYFEVVPKAGDSISIAYNLLKPINSRPEFQPNNVELSN